LRYWSYRAELQCQSLTMADKSRASEVGGPFTALPGEAGIRPGIYAGLGGCLLLLLLSQFGPSPINGTEMVETCGKRSRSIC